MLPSSPRARDVVESQEASSQGGIFDGDLLRLSSEQPQSPNAPADQSWRNALLEIVERLGCGYLLIDGQQVIESNSIARAILRRDAAVPSASGDGLYGALQGLLQRTKTKVPTATFSWLAVSLNEGFSILSTQLNDERREGPRAVIILDLDSRPTPNPVLLQHIFGLTSAETRLAVHLAEGSTPSEVARRLRLSRTTVRTQLAAVFAKTQTRRQAELVSLLGRISVLP